MRKAECHPDRGYYALDFCETCYERFVYHGRRVVLSSYDQWLELKDLGFTLVEAANRIGIQAESLKKVIRHRQRAQGPGA